jgi:hypothetical protein
MSESSAADVRKQNIAAMGPELGKIFTILSNELTLLCWQCHELRELYPGPGPRLDLMNRSAPFFFWLLQRTWWQDTLLGIARLMAPPRSVGKPNLTLKMLPGIIADPTLSGRVAAMIAATETQAHFAMEWRNKRIAHRDLGHP